MSAQQGRLARLRHPLAAVLGVAGILVGSIAALGTSSASAAGNELVGTTNFTCVVTPSDGVAYPAYPYAGTITLTALRPAGSTEVTVSAKMSQMSGVAPVNVSARFLNELKLEVAGNPVSVKGDGTVKLVAHGNPPVGEPFTMPDLSGKFTSSDPTVAITVKGFTFELPTFLMKGVCDTTSGTALGNLTIVEGVPPTLTPTPTTTTSATATPTPKPSATAKTGKSGKAAKGTVPFTCVLSINPDPFEYKATMTMSGYREKAGDDVSLVSTMSDLPGMSPVPIQGSMDYTLDAKVGGKKVTLKSTGDVNAQPKAVVPVKDLSGSVDAEGDELAVVVTGFTFNFPSGGVGAKCTADSVALSKMTVGSEPIDTDSASSSATTSTTTGGTTTTALPKTGGGDSMPVVALWALALTLLGVAGLLCVPRTRRQH